ncbi:hypothetical protein RUND412_000240, partial [Rhizina undulata]
IICRARTPNRGCPESPRITTADTVKVTAVKLEAPGLPELTGENFWQTIGKEYWFIKHYSAPYGKASATSTSPLPPHPSPRHSVPSFPEAYNFRFGSLNCVMHGDFVTVPETYDTGKHDLRTLSDFAEKYLEIIKPGSRLTTTIVLPAVQTHKPAAVKKEKETADATFESQSEQDFEAIGRGLFHED